MKYLKKFLALGMCAGVMSTSSCSAVLPDEVMNFYLSTGIDEVILRSPEGLRAICCSLNGPKITGQTALENYLSQIYNQEKASNNLDSLRTRLATHLEDIREKVSVSFKRSVGYGEAKSAASYGPTLPEPSQYDYSPFVVVGNTRTRSYFYPPKTVTVPLLAILPPQWAIYGLHMHTGGNRKVKSVVSSSSTSTEPRSIDSIPYFEDSVFDSIATSDTEILSWLFGDTTTEKTDITYDKIKITESK